MGPAPPVVLARKDELPFSTQEWQVLAEYMSTWPDELFQAEDDRLVVNGNFLTQDNFTTYVQQKRTHLPTAFLPLAFPLRSIVVPNCLRMEALNGLEGEVVQFSRDRVGVFAAFDDVRTCLQAEGSPANVSMRTPKVTEMKTGLDLLSETAMEIAAKMRNRHFCPVHRNEFVNHEVAAANLTIGNSLICVVNHNIYTRI